MDCTRRECSWRWALLPLLVVLFLHLPFGAAQEDKIQPYCACRNVTFFKNQSHGLIKTPRFPRSYCGKLNCNWTIEASGEDEAIRLHWDQFRLHPSDYVIVYYVERGVRVPVAKFSKQYTNLRDFVTPKGVQVELNFVSRGDAVGYPGFMLEFTRFKASSTNCACNRLLYNVSAPGEVTSPGWPSKYCHNLKCYYILHAVDKTKGVQVTFDKLDFHDSGDYIFIMNIYNPFNQSKDAREQWGDLQTFLSGSRNGNRTFYSKGRDLLLIFVTDHSDNKTGFHAHYKQVENRCGCKDKELTSDSGNIVAPGYPDHFCEDVSCLYKLKAPEGKVVQLNLQPGPDTWRLDSLDRLSWVDTKNTSLVIKDWSKEIQQKSFTSTGRELFLRFTTGPVPGTGFNISYKMVSKSDCKCPNISGDGQIATLAEKTKGSLASPASPKAYCGPSDCFYVLKAPTSTARRLFLNGSVETAGESDFLQLSAAPLNATASAKLVQSYSGDSKRINDSMDDVGVVVVQWHAEREGNKGGKTGFSFAYEWRENCQCSERKRKATQKEQELKSPFFDGSGYCNNFVCNWLLEAPPGERIVFKLLELDSEKAADFLLAFDGKTTKDDRLLQLSGTVKAPNIVHGTHHRLLVQFQADGATTGKGFRGVYYSEPYDFANEKANPNAFRPENLFNRQRQRDFEDDMAYRMGSIVTREVKEQVDRLRDEQKVAARKAAAAKPKPQTRAWDILGPILLALVAAVMAVGAVVYLKTNGWCTPGELPRDYNFANPSMDAEHGSGSPSEEAGTSSASASAEADETTTPTEPDVTEDGSLVDLSDDSAL